MEPRAAPLDRNRNMSPKALKEAGWGEEALVLRNARELEMLILLSMADWLQQVHATDRLLSATSERSFFLVAGGGR